MKTVIFGTGATGGFFGAMLARAGADVSFVARGKQLAALRKDGLRVESVEFGKVHVERPRVADDPRSLGVADLVLVCVKAYDLDAAAKDLAPLVGKRTVVLPILNGVDAHERIGAVVGRRHVLPASARIEAILRAPGVVEHTSAGVHSITFGEPDGTMTERVADVAATLGKGGFKVVPSPKSVEELWRKFAFMCGFSGVCAVTRLPKGAIFDSPPTRRLVVDATREVVATAKARGFGFGDDVVDQQIGFLEKRSWTFASSMMRDVESGRPIEIEALNGAAVRFAETHGVDAPTNRFIYACLKPYERGKPAPPVSSARVDVPPVIPK